MVSTRLMAITTGPCNNEINLSLRSSTNNSDVVPSSTPGLLQPSPLSLPTVGNNTLSTVLNNLVVSNRHSAIITAPQSSITSTYNIIEGGTITLRQQNIELLDLPVEILDKIFGYVGYKKTAQLRVVSRQMNNICSSVLNSTFQRLQNQLLKRFQTVKAKMPRRESARRNHPLACECDIIETCFMRLSLLQMTFGKHIERKHCCFFPGGILDEVYNVLNYIRNTPKLARPFKVTDELFDLSTMAMEYFKEYIEPTLPDFQRTFFSTTKQNFLLETKSSLSVRETNSSSIPSPPQSNMVLRKGIRKIKQGMKRYNNQLSVLRNELRSCKRKANEQAKQISDQQKLLAEQQKQTIEYANRLDENDKKNEEMSRKFSTLLQELNKCKTELQYWRSKSPATPVCTSCGQMIAVPPEEMEALVNQGVKPEDMGIEPIVNDEEDYDTISENNIKLTNENSDEVQIINPNKTDKNCDIIYNNTHLVNDNMGQISHLLSPGSQNLPKISIPIVTTTVTAPVAVSTTILSHNYNKVISPKRKLNETSDNTVDNNKKIRRVQTKSNNSSNSSRQSNLFLGSISKGRK